MKKTTTIIAMLLVLCCMLAACSKHNTGGTLVVTTQHGDTATSWATTYNLETCRSSCSGTSTRITETDGQPFTNPFSVTVAEGEKVSIEFRCNKCGHTETIVDIVPPAIEHFCCECEESPKIVDMAIVMGDMSTEEDTTLS